MRIVVLWPMALVIFISTFHFETLFWPLPDPLDSWFERTEIFIFKSLKAPHPWFKCAKLSLIWSSGLESMKMWKVYDNIDFDKGHALLEKSTWDMWFRWANKFIITWYSLYDFSNQVSNLNLEDAGF